ncbi:hypothetical protein CC85DRAFT_287539, partial [Cutaneotrichosporon oleaginosum]
MEYWRVRGGTAGLLIETRHTVRLVCSSFSRGCTLVEFQALNSGSKLSRERALAQLGQRRHAELGGPRDTRLAHCSNPCPSHSAAPTRPTRSDNSNPFTYILICRHERFSHVSTDTRAEGRNRGPKPGSQELSPSLDHLAPSQDLHQAKRRSFEYMLMHL